MKESALLQKSAQRHNIRFVIYLLILGAFVIFFRLGDRDMWNGLESESAVAGWDRDETGRILIPHILDQPFIDNRPPGAWWLIAATYKLTGVRNTWTARLPSALAALGCVLLVYAMGRRAANANAGFLSALILMGMFVVLSSIVTWSWIMLRTGRRRISWKIAWISCIIVLAFFMGDIYQRAGNTLISRKFAEKVAQAVPDNGRLGTLDDHAALLFHLGRRVEYVEIADANKFLENPNHYLIVHKESDLQKIDERHRRLIISGYPYRYRHLAYLLQGKQLQDNSRLK